MTGSREERFDVLWRENAPAVLRYARRRVDPDDVEDVLAETFVVAWRRLDDVPPFPLPWLLGVARGTAANLRRSRTRRQALRARAADDARSGSAHDPDLEPVMAALETLPPADRELLTLLAWDGLTRGEAAESLGCSRGALAVRLHRARKRLTAAMAVGPPVDRPPPEPALRLETTRSARP